MKLSLAHAILAATAASTSARLFAKNEARQLQAPDDIVCNMMFDPVCGADGRTYSNDCLAEAAGVAVVSTGECRTPVQPTLPVRCPLDIALVCGADGVTYDNTCLAEAAGTTVASKGVCPEVPTMLTAIAATASPDIVCNMMYDPVCGANGETYSNDCLAQAAGTTVVSNGECTSEALPVPCPENIALVCGADGVTYDNECLAALQEQLLFLKKRAPSPALRKAAGITVVSEGVCAKPSISDAEVVTNDVNSESATSPSPTVKPTPTVDSPVPADATDGPADPVVGSLSDPDSPSSAPTAIIGTATLLVISAFIFVAV
eukprot:scaffold10448_cov150-Skeletonema_dohrnii-CCMP3373.AAC.2